MSQTLYFVPAFDSTNYGYWKARLRFLKSIDVWKIVESSWIKPEETIDELTVAQTSARLSNDKALYALCQALLPHEFTKISNYESAQEA